MAEIMLDELYKVMECPNTFEADCVTTTTTAGSPAKNFLYYGDSNTTLSSDSIYPCDPEIADNLLVDVAGKKFSVKKMLAILANAYLPIRKEDDKVTLIKISEILEAE